MKQQHTRPCELPLPLHIKRRGPGATIELPFLTAEEAWCVTAVLEDLLRTIWHTHGNAMADYQALNFPNLPPPPCSQNLQNDQNMHVPF